MTNPFDIIKHVNEKTDLDFDIQDYAPWLVNKAMSNVMNSIFFSEVMNQYSHLDKDIQYEFYYYGLPKAKRFGKWNKAAAINNNVNLIMKEYQVNRQVADSYLKLMSDDAIKQLEEKTNEGGTK